jgi:hypothetical protein
MLCNRNGQKCASSAQLVGPESPYCKEKVILGCVIFKEVISFKLSRIQCKSSEFSLDNVQ